MSLIINNKICKECYLLLNVDSFYKNKKKCKICIKKQQQEYYKKNKDKIKQYVKCHKQINKDYYKEYHKKYYKIYSQNNQEKNKERLKQYRQNNKEKIKEYSKEHIKNKKKNNITFKLRNNVSKSICSALKRNNCFKNKISCLMYLNYSIEELKLHLEKQFEPWMNWGNHGNYKVKNWKDNDMSTWTWQIDHIIPHSTFKYKNMEDEEFKKCWALENLRPLSAKQNIKDGNRRQL